MGDKNPKRYVFFVIILIVVVASFIFVRGQSAPYPGHVGPEVCSEQFCVTTNGEVGIGTTPEVGYALSILGEVKTTGGITAVGDICTTTMGGPPGDLCVGSGIDVATSTSVSGYPQKKCNPSDCSFSTDDDDLGTSESGSQSVNCDYGMIPLSCGGYAQAEGGASKRLNKFAIFPYYGTGDSIPPTTTDSGCELQYRGTTDAETTVDYSVVAYCVRFNYPA